MRRPRAEVIAEAAAGLKDFLRSSSPERAIKTGTLGRSFLSTGTLAMVLRTSWPMTMRPKMVCLPFKWGVGSRVMKNLAELDCMTEQDG